MIPDTRQLLTEARAGSTEATDQLFERVYAELRRLARAQLRRRAATLGPTELVHEAYLKLFGDSRLEVQDRVHFLSLAARGMRQILVDHFRRKTADRRGGGAHHTSLDDEAAANDSRGATILAVDEALERLSQRDERLGRVVEYKFFGGMTEREIGEALDLSVRSVSNDWRRAKAWLSRELEGSGPVAR